MERKHMNEVREIIHRLRQGESVRGIALEMRLARNTVRKYRDMARKHGLLEDERAPLPDMVTLGRMLGPPPVPKQTRSTLEPFAEKVEALLNACVPMTVILRHLQEECGYTGSYSSVKRYINRVHPKSPEAVCRIETAPGEQAQVDFGYAGLRWDPANGRRRKTWMFIMTLSWSRHQYVEFVFDQKSETWLQCHENAFRWFAGVPKQVVLDNLKDGVILHDLHDPVLAEPYRRLAQHYGFVINPNRPGTPEHKGKVESGVGYVKNNFLAGETFADRTAMNARVKTWVMNTAGLRIHGTTKEQPLARFTTVEREALQPLPQTRFEMLAAYHALVHRDCHVVVDGRYYSVPHTYIGRKVDVYVGRKIVEIYSGTALLVTHPVAKNKGGRKTLMSHYPADKRAYLENPPERCRERAAEIGPSCETVVETLLTHPVHDKLRSVHSLLRLVESVGAHRLEAACRRALYFGDPGYRRVKAILTSGLDSEPLDGETGGVVSAGAYQYARPAASFFPTEGGVQL